MPKKNDIGKQRIYYSAEMLLDESFLQFPRWLMSDPQFAKLSNDAKILYVNLKDRFRLSLKNRWVDRENRVFVICKRESMARMLNKSDRTIKKIVEELKAAELIEDVQNGLNKPNYIYLLMPKFSDRDKELSFDEDDWVNNDCPEICESSPENIRNDTAEDISFRTRRNYDSRNRSNFASGTEESADPTEAKNLRSSNNDFTKDEVNNIHSFHSTGREREKERFEEYIDQGKRFEHLSFSEVCAIARKRTGADECLGALYWMESEKAKRDMVNSLVSLMAEVYLCQDHYFRAGNKSYHSGIFRQKLLLIDEKLFWGILCDLEKAKDISNVKAYLSEVLYNAPVVNSAGALKISSRP